MENAPDTARPSAWQRALGIALLVVCIHLTSCASAVRALLG